MKNKDIDILIIGAGVVGCAIAYECSKRFPDKIVAVVEQNSVVALETSSHNSGMLHIGVTEKLGSLKSKLCVRGYRLADSFIKTNNVSAKKTGMIIAVPKHLPTSPLFRQLGLLFVLMFRAIYLRVPFKLILGKQSYEPDIDTVAGLYLPEFSIVDPVQFTQTLKKEAEARGAKFYFNNSVRKIRNENDSYLVTTSGYVFKCRSVINAAGLYADKIATVAGFTNYKIYPWRGEYYRVLNNEIYVSRPVSSVMPRHHGKGVQILPSLDGKLYLGPNSYPTERRNDYKTVVTPPEEFINRVKGFLPKIQIEDLKWAFAGIRPRLHNQYGDTDFIISKDSSCPIFINLIGIESPGLTSALAIAEYVSEKMLE